MKAQQSWHVIMKPQRKRKVAMILKKQATVSKPRHGAGVAAEAYAAQEKFPEGNDYLKGKVLKKKKKHVLSALVSNVEVQLNGEETCNDDAQRRGSCVAHQDKSAEKFTTDVPIVTRQWGNLAGNFHDYCSPNLPGGQLSLDLKDGVSQSHEGDITPDERAVEESHVIEGVPTCSVGKCGLVYEVRGKLDFYLPARWHTIVTESAVHVLYVSAQGMFTQRYVQFLLDGNITLLVHGQPIELNSIFKNSPSSVPLIAETVDKFVDSIVKFIEHISQYEVCGGCDNEDYRVAWGTTPLGDIDKNPYGECRYYETFRSFACKRLVKRRNWRCNECTKVLRSLKLRAHFAQVEQPHPNTPNIYLSEQQKLQKLNDQKRELAASKKVVIRLREKIENIIKSEGIDVDNDLSQDLSSILNANNVTAAQSIFLQQQIKCSQGSKVGMRWHPTMIRLALSLHITSPAAYRMLQDTGMIKLPSTRTLFDYAHVKPTKAGFDEVVLDDVAQKIKGFSNNYQKYHVLMADEMHISQNLVFNKSTGNVIGYANLNEIDQEISKLENYLNNEDHESREPAIAQKVLVYMIKGVSSGIKEVVASFPVAHLSVNQMYVWTWKVIRALETGGIAVIAFVSDGFSVKR